MTIHKFSVSSQMVMPVQQTTEDLVDLIPAGVYQVAEMPFGGPIYLKPSDNFVMPKKLYGETVKMSERIMQTHLSRTTSTGILLVGEKGSGKSLLAKHLAVSAIAKGWPIITITAPWHGDKFVAFLESIKQDCVVLFDEFEKVYDSETQERMLSLFDGLSNTKKMFILTCNDKHKIDQNMINRPGRIYYNISFGGLSPEFIEEYCVDNLNDASQKTIDEIVGISYLFGAFSFDMLQALVEERNRYPNEELDDVIRLLNVRPDIFESYVKYFYRVFHKDSGEQIVFVGPSSSYRNKRNSFSIDGNPLKHRSIIIYAEYYDLPASEIEKLQKSARGQKKLAESQEYLDFYLEKKDLKSFDKATQEFIYEKDGFVVKFKKETQEESYSRLAF